MKLKIVVYFIFALLLVETVAPIGIGSTITKIPFEPGEKREYTFYVVNNEAKEVDAEISVDGPLAGHITMSESTIHLYSNELMKPFKIAIEFPEYANGDTKIIVSEISNLSGGVVARANALLRIEGRPENFSNKVAEDAPTNTTYLKKEEENKKEIISHEEVPSAIFENETSKTALFFALGIMLINIVVLYILKRKGGKSLESIPLDSRLVEFVSKSLENGKTEEEIKKVLKEVGWLDEVIDAAFKSIKK